MDKRKKSYLWNYFLPASKNKARCKLCNQDFSYKTTISNLKRHIERMHPKLLGVEGLPVMNDSGTEMIEDQNNEDEYVRGENIVVEYSDDSDINQEKSRVPRILRTATPKRLEPSEKPQSERIKRIKLSGKFSNLEDYKTELIKIEIEAARVDLELKEKQLIFAKREDDRRQREHEINLKIKEAQLEALKSENNT